MAVPSIAILLMFHKIADYNLNEIQFITLLFIYSALYVKSKIFLQRYKSSGFPPTFF